MSAYGALPRGTALETLFFFELNTTSGGVVSRKFTVPRRGAPPFYSTWNRINRLTRSLKAEPDCSITEATTRPPRRNPPVGNRSTPV